jgi:AMP phosphorylase
MEILDSGKALKKFNQIISAQGGNLNLIPLAKYKRDIFPRKSGKIERINNKSINLLARIAGCPADKGSGIYLHHHVGDEIGDHERILTIYSESKSRLNQAVKFLKESKPIEIK